MATSAENRVHQRHSVRLEAEIMISERATEKVVMTTKGFVLDVSYGGIKLEIATLPAQTVRELELGQADLTIAVQGTEQLVQLKGRAAWVITGERVTLGVKFVAAVSKDVEKLVGWADTTRHAPRWMPLLAKLGAAACIVVLAISWRSASTRADRAEAEVERQLASGISFEQAAEAARQAAEAEQKRAREMVAKQPVAKEPASAPTPTPSPKLGIPFEVRWKDASVQQIQITSLHAEDGLLLGVFERTNPGVNAKPLAVGITIEIVDRAGTKTAGCTIDAIDVAPTANEVDFDCGIEPPADSSLFVTVSQTSR